MTGASYPQVLRLPRTVAGCEHLRECVRLAGGWSFPDGSNAADYDWDQAVIEADKDIEAYEQWKRTCEQEEAERSRRDGL
jgi:hypothetical protein